VRRVWLEPNSPPGFPQAIQAILAADLVIIGPGSLYTSILPNLLVPDIADSIRSSRALKLYVCNVATQPGETDGYSCSDHIRAIEEHAGDNLFDIVVCNRDFVAGLPSGADWVGIDDDVNGMATLYYADLVDREQPWRHDGNKLAQATINLLEERTGPLAD
jgi:uncharacterized cofD-like protein